MKALEIKFQRGTSPLGPPPGSDPDNAGIICIKQYKTCNSIATTAIQFLQPIGNLGIGISTSAAVLASASAPTLQKIYFCLSKFFLKNISFMYNTPQYFFLCLVIRGQYHFATITHFSTISHSSNQWRPSVFQKFLETFQ